LVAAQELSINITTATVMIENNNFFIPLNWVKSQQKIIEEIQRKMVGRVLYHRCMAAKIMPADLFSKHITGFLKKKLHFRY